MSVASGAALSVRQATLDDLPTVVALRLALLREHRDDPIYGRPRPDIETRARRIFASQLESTGEATFLAERGGEAVGILRVVHSAGSPLLLPTHYGYISSVYVIPPERRHGVLRSLLTQAEAWCESRELTELRLHHAPSNVLGAAVWEQLGFEVAEVLRVRPLRRR